MKSTPGQSNLNERSGAVEKRSSLWFMTWHAPRSAFTLIELLVVIGIIGLLAGLIVGLTSYTARKTKESRVRAELNQIATAIEAYKARFAHYPPDNVVSRNPFLVVNPVTNSLFYELTGVLVEEDRRGGGTFRSPNRSQKFGAGMTQKYFGLDGIENAGTGAKDIKPFIQLKSTQRAVINPKSAPEPELEVLVVSVPWPLTRKGDQPSPVPGLNPWRYVSTQPTNNPATFDLWAEYVEGGKVKIICNWSKDILEK